MYLSVSPSLLLSLSLGSLALLHSCSHVFVPVVSFPPKSCGLPSLRGGAAFRGAAFSASSFGVVLLLSPLDGAAVSSPLFGSGACPPASLGVISIPLRGIVDGES